MSYTVAGNFHLQYGEGCNCDPVHRGLHATENNLTGSNCEDALPIDGTLLAS